MPLLAGALWVSLGCGESSDALSTPPLDGGSGDVFPDTQVSSVEFEAGTELTLIAGQTVPLAVQVLPAGIHTVRFALIGNTDEAFLSPSVVETSPDGRAQATLTVLGVASTFGVRAAAGRVSTSLNVTTLEASQASIVVTPDYDGHRAIDEWVASVHVGATCSSLMGVPYPDGALVARERGDSIRIDGITTDVPFAVVVRAGQFAGGCQGVAPLRAKAVESVSVEVEDRPMQTGNLALSVGFGVEATEEPNPALDELAFRAVSPLTGSASDDLAALLDAMSSLAGDPGAFEAARSARGWRAALVNGLAPELPGVGLRTLVQNWMRSGIDLLEAPGALQGTMEATGPNGAATLRLGSVIGLEPPEAGFEVMNTASVAAEADDYLRLGATLQFSPSRFLSAAANQAALTRDPDRVSASDSMATEFGCDEVASIITGAGATPGEAYGGCDEGCAESLCRDAMGVLWSRVAESELPPVPWQISGGSRASIDDAARPTGVEGNWIGTILVSDFGSTPIQGPFTGDALP